MFMTFLRFGRDNMVRGRQIGITEEQRKDYERWRIPGGKNYLTDSKRKNLKYNIKAIIEQEIEDLTWFFEVSGGLRNSPIEITLPKRRSRFSSFTGDLAATLGMISLIEEWQASLESLKEAIAADPQRFMRS